MLSGYKDAAYELEDDWAVQGLHCIETGRSRLSGSCTATSLSRRCALHEDRNIARTGALFPPKLMPGKMCLPDVERVAKVIA